MEKEWTNYEKIEQKINIIDKEKMKNEIESVLNEWKAEQDKIVLETIENLTKEQLATYIESSFKHSDWWDNYSTMVWNHYHWFMVQAALDFLSDKYQDKKYDESGEENEEGKSLDEWIELWWWIDNKIGSKTQTAVRIAQKILWIHVDWYAGPQFLAKVCAVLRWQSNPTDFVVREKPNYSYNFNNKSKTINVWWNNNAEQSSNIEFSYSSDISDLVPKENWDIQIFKDWKYSWCYLKKDWNSYKIAYDKWYDKNKRWEFKFDSNKNTIIYIGASQVVQEKESTHVKNENRTEFKLTTWSSNYGSRYNLELGNNDNPIESQLYKIQYDNLATKFSNDGGYYWFSRSQYTWYNYASNPFVWVNCWSHNSASMGNAAQDPDFKVKINLHDFMKTDWSIDNDKIIKELNIVKSQHENANAITESKNSLYSSINEFTLDEIWLWDKKTQAGYIALMSYFDNWKIKIDKKHTLPKRDDSWNLNFDLDPKWRWNCPKYFTSIKIYKKEMTDRQWKYSIWQFKKAFGKKIDEIVNKNILSTI